MSHKEELSIFLDELELYGYNINRLAKEVGYEPDSIKKALRPSTKVSDKMYNKIKGIHEKEKAKAVNPMNEMYEEVKQLRAEMYVTRIMIANVLASLTKTSDGAIIMAQYDSLIEKYIQDNYSGNK